MKTLLKRILFIDLKRLLYGKKSTVIEIDGLTKPQKIALEDLLKQWETLGKLGCSRWTSFFADGDGNFRPKIRIDGRKPKFQNPIASENMSRTVVVGGKKE